MVVNLNVTINKVTITNQTTPEINQGEYNVNTCNFDFSQEFEGLEKRAVFSNVLGQKYLVEIKNNICIIPEEILGLVGTLTIGVYGFINNENELQLRYSPTPATLPINEGSYIPNTPVPISPEMMTDLYKEVSDFISTVQAMLDSGDFNGVGIQNIIFNPNYTMTIILTNGSTITSPSLRGEKGDPGEPGQNGTNGIDGHDGVDGQDAKINGVNTLTIEAGSNINLEQEGNTLTISSIGGGTSNYQDLTNKPSINSVTLTGNKSLSDLGIQPAGNYLTSETDPTVPSYVKNITQENINNWNNKSDFSGNYNDLSNKPTIPAEVTENIVSGWGFTKNTGTYSKPQNGIPKTDLESAVQTSLGKADTALQTHQDITGKLDTTKVKNAQSTTAGDVYDVRYINSVLGDIETLLQEV